MGYDRLYYWKKAYALFPGIWRPVSADILAPHYARRRAERGPARALLDAVAGTLFHLWLPWRTRMVRRRFGLEHSWYRRALGIARVAFADPNDIALFRIERPEEFGRYIRRFEDAAFNKQINPAGWRRDCVLADKRLFAERCLAGGLPHPETVAATGPDGIRILADPAGRPLLAKPIHGEGGGGVRVLGTVTDRTALEAVLRDLPGKAPVLVQPLAFPHPALADLAMSALPTIRIVTMLDEEGRPEIVSATFRCPTAPDARIDNMKAGGLIMAVDLGSGRLGAACKGYGGGDYAIHPVTGAPIEGRHLPGWEAAKALAARAHGAFPEYVLIGWDVALTPDAPILIEGNGKPGVLMPQRAARAGLAQGRYGELLAHHLKHSRPLSATKR
ncbi:sugar-transfer associated ATP-grasp domain-containing protein [Sphingomonas sp. PR090111-T3T-6A]|uniref:sugar-transfer associated ATP-grasp domain-containing protein n=1 Tax=Sphingomonas sp. PR090111-T3T-6A TaxID=685778 RepID=UPI000375B797|nr:sugar-transfer associated ATP-grasp domain-containing protein [Sphingomonas sp. PR090111-T3T-6A]